MRVRLRPIQPEDLGPLYTASLDPAVAISWRFRGATPSFDEFAQKLWAGVLAQFVVEHVRSRDLVGLVCVYSPVEQRHAKIAVMATPRWLKGGLVIEGVAIFLEYVFHTWPFEKLYAEMLTPSYERVSSGESRLFDVEGVLRGHDRIGGEPVDLHVVAFWREMWAKESRRVLPHLMR